MEELNTQVPVAPPRREPGSCPQITRDNRGPSVSGPPGRWAVHALVHPTKQA